MIDHATIKSINRFRSSSVAKSHMLFMKSYLKSLNSLTSEIQKFEYLPVKFCEIPFYILKMEMVMTAVAVGTVSKVLALPVE